MKRIISKNRNRTEKNKNSFDYSKGEIILYYTINNNDRSHCLSYSGNNMQESFESRKAALSKVLHFITSSSFLFDHLPEIIEVESDGSKVKII